MLGKTMMIPRAIRRLVGGLLLGLLPLAGMAESLALPAPGSDLVGRIRMSRHAKATP
jgi:hypothetical protein